MSSNPTSSKFSANGKTPEDQHYNIDKRPREVDDNADAQAAQQQQNGDQNGDANASLGQPEGGYPEQRHAGAVGLGPEYGVQQKAVCA